MLIRFANISMKMNDPLQTLYQIMSGRQPAAATVSFNESYIMVFLCSFYLCLLASWYEGTDVSFLKDKWIKKWQSYCTVKGMLLNQF